MTKRKLINELENLDCSDDTPVEMNIYYENSKYIIVVLEGDVITLSAGN